jgi:hypothetical protein
MDVVNRPYRVRQVPMGLCSLGSHAALEKFYGSRRWLATDLALLKEHGTAGNACWRVHANCKIGVVRMLSVEADVDLSGRSVARHSAVFCADYV